MEGESFDVAFVDIFHVSSVFFRDEYVGNSGTLGGKNLLFDATHWKYASTKGYFAGHSNMVTYSALGKCRSKRGGYCDAGRRTILRSGTFGNMDMDAPTVEYAVVNVEFRSVSLDIFQSEHGTFLHHVAEVAGECEFRAFATAYAGLDVEDFAAYRCPRQTGYYTRVFVALVFVAVEERFAKERFHVACLNGLACIGHFLFAVCGREVRHFTEEFVYLLFELTHTAFAGVVFYYLIYGRNADLEFSTFAEVVFLLFLGNEVTSGYFAFFFGQIAFHFDDFHAVKQGPGDGLQIVGGSNEEHVGEVEVEVEIVVVERAVLLRVEHFEKRAVGVAVVVVFADFVYFVKHKERIDGTGLDDAFDNTSGHGTDIGAAMAANLGFVVHTAEGDANILATQGFGDAATERGFADTRRTVEADDGRLFFCGEAQRGEMFEYAFLYTLHAEVVAVEHAFGIFHIEIVLGMTSPWEVYHGLQIVEHHVVVGILLVHATQLLEFAVIRGFYLLGERYCLSFVFQVFDVGVGSLTELFLDILYLLGEEVFALLLVELGTCTFLYFMTQECELTLAVEHLKEFVGSLLHVVLLEECFTLFLLHRHIGADEVDEKHGMRDVLHREDGLLLHELVAEVEELD